MDRISPNFVYEFILTRSTLRLLHIIFGTFVPELWPLIYSKNLFMLNILRTNGQILTKLYLTIYTDKIYVGIVSCHFSQFVRELWPFIDVRITLPLHILRHFGLILHARHCSWAIVRFSDNSCLNISIPILMLFYSLFSNWSIASRTKMYIVQGNVI